MIAEQYTMNIPAVSISTRGQQSNSSKLYIQQPGTGRRSSGVRCGVRGKVLLDAPGQSAQPILPGQGM